MNFYNFFELTKFGIKKNGDSKKLSLNKFNFIHKNTFGQIQDSKAEIEHQSFFDLH